MEDAVQDQAERGWLVVDVMNVVGSRPDGWWRDRAGAVARLVEQLEAHALRNDLDVTAVVDGHGPAPAAVAGRGGVDVRHAGRGPDAADDLIVELLTATARTASVVTADRELRRRVDIHGASCRGPRTLLDELAAHGDQ